MKGILNGLKNLRYWFPVIWKDRQWDYDFLLKLLLHKLERMEDYFIDGDDDCEIYELEECIGLIKKIRGAIFIDEALDQHKKKWGKALVIFNDPYFWGYWFENATTYEENDLAYEDYQEARQRGDLQYWLAIKRMFDLMGDYILNWWN